MPGIRLSASDWPLASGSRGSEMTESARGRLMQSARRIDDAERTANRCRGVRRTDDPERAL